MTQTELVDELLAWGYRRVSTASIKWRIALAFRGAEKTLVVLIRRRGVDLLESPLTLTQMTNGDGLLSISMHREGDRFVELAYTEAEASTHDRALYIASCIAQDKPVGDDLFLRLGIGPREWAMKYGELSKGDGGGTMQDVYNAVSNDDGEDAYLSDGMWIRSDGTTYER
jgi:hypothetical protein